MNSMRLLAASMIVAGFLAGPATAESTLRSVHFAPGQSSATLDGAIVRGDSDLWSFAANAGQTADIKVTSTEDNASFTIYQPPASVTHGDDGLDVSGTVLPGGEPTDPPLDPGAQKHWKGKLPATGAYYIEVAGDRGNATYTLTIAIE